ncbi:MAG: M23 family metallopeptidase [Bacilli bacterium]|jgi:murein DD-endopeptidase MepM/ murein hydrolase activator NlpD
MKKRFSVIIIVLLSIGLLIWRTSFSKIEKLLPININISAVMVKQGQYIELIIDNITSSNLTVETNIVKADNFKLYYDDNKAFCFIPIMVTKLPGIYYIRIYDDITLIEDYLITIAEEDFAIQYLVVEPSLFQEVTSSKAYDEYKQAINKAQSYDVKERWWEHEFIQPVPGRITTEFGIKRYTNDNLSPTRHLGIDIANDKGTEVKATASGRVVFADYLTTAGNFVIIAHGMGLFSYYAHLDSLNVVENQDVKQGAVIGNMGSTGFATGPHLHFELTFHRVAINPWQFFKK